MNRLDSNAWFYIALIASIIVIGVCQVAEKYNNRPAMRFFVIIDGKTVEMEEMKEDVK